MLNLKSLLGKTSSPKPKVGHEPDFDITGNANKRIGPDTPPGKVANPVFTDTTPEEEDDEETKAFKLARAKARAAGQPLEENNTLKVSRADRENVQFMSGVKIAVQDKAQDRKRDLAGLPDDFVRGYNSVKRSSWWDKANDKLTQWAASLGRSYGPRQ